MANQGQFNFTTGAAGAPNFYDYVEQVSAGYVMNTFDFSKFRFIAGLRVEGTNLDTLTWNNQLSTLSIKAGGDYITVLPSASLRYALTGNDDFRLVFSRGLSRPDPQDIAQSFSISAPAAGGRGSISFGNPGLVAETSYNYDLLFEHYMNTFGAIQAGFFFKSLYDPIVNTSRTVANYTPPASYNTSGYIGTYDISQPLNAGAAHLFGLEIAYLQHFTGLPGFLSGLGLSANYSYTDSGTEGLPGRSDNPHLLRQAPNTWNISPTYDKGRYSYRLGLSYNQANIFSYQYQDGLAGGVKGPLSDTYLYTHFQIDMQGSARLEKGFTFIASILNANNEVFGFYNGSPQYLIQREFYKPTYSLGLRWSPTHRSKRLCRAGSGRCPSCTRQSGNVPTRGSGAIDGIYCRCALGYRQMSRVVFAEIKALFRVCLLGFLSFAEKRFSEGIMKSKWLASCMVVALLSAAAFAAAVNYQLLKKVPVPGAGGWDYLSVDDAARRIYISHATQVDVLDADSFALVGTIPNTPGVHGIAIASAEGRGYISAGKSDAVVPFDLKTLKPLPEIKVGKKPDAIIFEPLTKRIYVMNGDSDNITVLNANDGSLAGTIDLGGGPEFAVSDGKGNLYVNLEEKNETLLVDVNAMKVKDRWPLAPCATPTSIAMDVENRRLFVGCRSHHFAVLNADNGKIVFTAPIGERVDAGAFDAKTRLVYLSTGDGKVFVFHQDSPDQYSLSQEITTLKGAKTMGYDPKTRNVIVPTSDNGAMSVLIFSPQQ